MTKKISSTLIIISLLFIIACLLAIIAVITVKEQNQCISNPLTYTAKLLKKSAGAPISCYCTPLVAGQSQRVYFNSEGNISFLEPFF